MLGAVPFRKNISHPVSIDEVELEGFCFPSTVKVSFDMSDFLLHSFVRKLVLVCPFRLGEIEVVQLSLVR